MTNSDKFRNEWNQIEKYLCNNAGIDIDGDEKDESRRNTVHSAIKKLETKARFGILRDQSMRRELSTMKALRNLIVHNEHLAEPSDETVSTITRIRELITHPPMATHVAIKPPHLITAEINDVIAKYLKIMNDLNITNIPVVHNQKIIGILSERSVVMWANHSSQENDGSILLTEKTFGDIKEFLDKPTGDDEYLQYKYCSRKTDLYYVRNLFGEAINQNRRLAAVFITQDGTPNSRIEGIITAWDIYKDADTI